jgi:hypothetical protein
MPYAILFGHPVFIHRAMHDRIFKEALIDKDALFRVSSRIHGTENSFEAKELCMAYLHKVAQENHNKFLEEWVQFDLNEEDAQKNVWDLLYDYGHLLQISQLTDIRDLGSKLMESYTGDEYTYPIGRVFQMDFPIYLKRSWWKVLGKHIVPKVSIVLDTGHVKRLVGCLTEFSVVYRGGIINFNHSGAVMSIGTA